LNGLKKIDLQINNNYKKYNNGKSVKRTQSED